MNIEDYRALAQELDIEPALLRAVHVVECGSGDGFLPSGRPKILFESHQFYKQLKNHFGQQFAEDIQQMYPNLCTPKWDRSTYKGGEKEWDRLLLARTIHEPSANMSASWGLGQIMGINYKLAGCNNLGEFVGMNLISTENQMKLFGNFLKNSGLLKHLRAKNWALFAKGYNGAGYAQNRYDEKLKSAYYKAIEQGYNS